jgi:2'-5' RNA ligase
MLDFSEWKSLDEKQGDTYEYGCSMVYFNSPEIKRIQESISPEDLYEEDGDRTFGLEDEHHVTLLYGIHANEVDDNDVMSISADNIPPIVLGNVSAFKNENYDVLKFDADCEKLHEINANLSKLPHTTSFPDYHPHATIAYLKSGCADKYIQQCEGLTEVVNPIEIVYSKPDGSKVRKSIR